MSVPQRGPRAGLLAVSMAVVTAVAVATPAAHADGPPAAPVTGTFSVLTYNVAGLPEPLSGSRPAKNTKEISKRINPYDVVNVQEDFAYHADLIAHDEHEYRTRPSVPSWVPVPGVPFSDGLNTLSNFKIGKLDRVTWDRCTNADCLTPKGFTYLRLELPGGRSLDLYNAHMNAGSGTEEMLRVRRDNIRQLSHYIGKHSAGRAVIVTGDTNSRYTRSGDAVRELRDGNALTDAWVELVRGGSTPGIDDGAPTCKDSTGCELLDKVLYRSGPGVTLEAIRYGNEYARFLDAKGKPLSDHNPPSVTFTFTTDGGG
ncbi:endonuclease/exonuclease/phosphatase family protein [Streptomyces sp. NPDC049910]|uniref:endonuclease/exonuclease/phosphatase family protein n=1 Tax=Streptomyces sp. NPDC049910 TaxID=3155278 RepID=UPI00342D1DEE